MATGFAELQYVLRSWYTHTVFGLIDEADVIVPPLWFGVELMSAPHFASPRMLVSVRWML